MICQYILLSFLCRRPTRSAPAALRRPVTRLVREGLAVGETTKIEWAQSTFNPWIGCAKDAP